MRTWVQVAAVLLPLFAAAAAGIQILQDQAARAAINRTYNDVTPPNVDSVSTVPAVNDGDWTNDMELLVKVCATDPDTFDNTDVSGLGQLWTRGGLFNSFSPHGALSACSNLSWFDDTDFTATFEVRDNSDNVSQPFTRQIRIDQTKPFAQITSGPTVSAIADTTPTFAFESSDVEVCVYPGIGSAASCANGPGVQLVFSGIDETLCAVDPSPLDDPDEYSPCTSPYTTPELANGPHLFCVMALDVAGNYSDPDCVEFEVLVIGDNTPPVLKIVYALYGTFSSLDTQAASAPVASTYTPNTWTTKDVAVFISCMDEAGGSGVATNTYPARMNFTSQGKHVFNPPGTCVDNAGNVAVEPVGLFIQIDTHAPTCTAPVSPYIISKTGSTPLVLDFTATDNLSGVTKTVANIVKTSLGGGSFAGAVPRPAPNTWTFAGATGALWKVTFKAVDGAGNERLCYRNVKAQ
ncbi:MAG: hypothetical protein ACKVVT_05535 [Dehalococcoidia bacterium]